MLDDSVVREAERLLREAGTIPATATLRQRAQLPGSRRHVVVRCDVEGNPALASVILKQVRRRHFDWPGRTPLELARVFAAETASLRFLATLPAITGRFPSLLEVDTLHGTLVLEDLGQLETLADRLLGSDPGRAATGLEAWAEALAELASASRSSVGAFFDGEFARPGEGATPFPVATITERRDAFIAACDEAGAPMPAAAQEAVERSVASALQPGTFTGFSPGDSCPDNVLFRPDGSAVLIDFEGGSIGSVLFDAAYITIPFPTCWCVNRIPAGPAASALARYRRVLGRSFPEALDDADWGPAFAAARITWSAALLSRWLTVEDFSDPRPIASRKERAVMATESLATAAHDAREPELEAFAAHLGGALRERWTMAEHPGPSYPAFANSPAES